MTFNSVPEDKARLVSEVSQVTLSLLPIYLEIRT